MGRNNDMIRGYLEGSNPRAPGRYRSRPPVTDGGPQDGESKADYRTRTNFDLPPEKEAYLKGKADTMEDLEAYRKPGQLPRPPKPPKEPKPPRAPRPPSARQQRAKLMRPVTKMSSLARLAKGSKRR